MFAWSTCEVFPALEKSSQFSAALKSPEIGAVTVPPEENTPCFAMLIACAGERSAIDSTANTAKSFFMIIPP